MQENEDPSYQTNRGSINDLSLFSSPSMPNISLGRPHLANAHSMNGFSAFNHFRNPAHAQLAAAVAAAAANHHQAQPPAAHSMSDGLGNAAPAYFTAGLPPPSGASVSSSALDLHLQKQQHQQQHHHQQQQQLLHHQLQLQQSHQIPQLTSSSGNTSTDSLNASSHNRPLDLQTQHHLQQQAAVAALQLTMPHFAAAVAAATSSNAAAAAAITDAQVAHARLNKQGHRPLGRTQSAPLPLGHPKLTGASTVQIEEVHYENSEAERQAMEQKRQYLAKKIRQTVLTKSNAHSNRELTLREEETNEVIDLTDKKQPPKTVTTSSVVMTSSSSASSSGGQWSSLSEASEYLKHQREMLMRQSMQVSWVVATKVVEINLSFCSPPDARG